MSWAANAMARLAEDMSILCENNQTWLDKAKRDLEDKNLQGRLYEILGLDPRPDILPMQYDVNNIDQQLAVFALAIASGTQFEFSDGRDANGWIGYMIGRCESDHTECLSDYLKPMERMIFACYV